MHARPTPHRRPSFLARCLTLALLALSLAGCLADTPPAVPSTATPKRPTATPKRPTSTPKTTPQAAAQAEWTILVYLDGDNNLEPEALADAINTWVWQAMRYVGGVTTVATSAADALLLGRGLCQDYSHVMLAICRAAGLPARYVSGHLLGEGGSHAWVEVLLPSAQGGFVAVPFDPTNHRRANLSYITIAVGRDYRDVSPTSGTYIAPYQGRLTASKRAGVTCVEYAAA